MKNPGAGQLAPASHTATAVCSPPPSTTKTFTAGRDGRLLGACELIPRARTQCRCDAKVESGADVRRVADLLRQHGAKDTDLW